MKKNLKRYLSLLLVLVMCVSLMPVSAFAEEVADDNNESENVHEHSYAAEVTMPTCTEEGYTTYTCSCGDSYVEDYVEATGHMPEEVAGIPPTVSESGINSGIRCKVCGEILEGCNELPARSIDAEIPEDAGNMSESETNIVATGPCGNSIEWTLTDDGTLTFAGIGAMLDYTDGDALWYKYHDSVTSAVISHGITTVGKSAFYGYSKLTDVEIGDTVATLCPDAFRECTSLERIELPDSVVHIQSGAFYLCTNLKYIKLSENLGAIEGSCGFYGCSSLTSITFPESMKSIGTSTFAETPNLSEIIFTGDAVTFVTESYSRAAFDGVTATAYYPCNNSTWIDSIMQKSGGNLTWVKNHSYSVSYEWMPDGSSCTATAVCKNDASHTMTETVDAVSSIKIPATCEEAGMTTYKAIFKNEQFEEQAKDIADVPVLQHDWQVNYIWADDGSTCTATAVCKNDASHTDTETVATTGETIIPSTCTDAGTTEYTASFTRAYFEKQTKDIADIPPLPHEFVNYKCIHCGFMEEGNVSLELSRNYLLLKKNDEIQLTLAEGYEKLSDRITWVSDDEEIAVVDENGMVTAKKAGTAFVTASLEAYGETYKAVCRIDVAGGEDGITEVTTTTSKLTVELYRTDYEQIDILPVCEQNLLDESIQTAFDAGGAENTAAIISGAAVERAEFSDSKASAVFDLVVKDDRTLLVVPKAGTLDGSIGTGSSYKSAVIVWLNGAEEPVTVTNDKGTATIAITLKKSTPSVKAAALKKFNTYDGSQSATQFLQFTGGTVTAVEIDTASAAKNASKDATLKGFALNGDMSVTAEKGRSSSGTLYLLCTVDGWTVKKAVSVNVSSSATKPKITFKPSSITLLPGSFDKQEVAYTITPAEFADSEITIKDSAGLDCTIEDGKIIVSAENAPAVANSYTVKVGIEDLEYKLAVKTLGATSKVTLLLNQTGVIDTGIPKSPVFVTAAIKNSHLGCGETFSCSVIRELKGSEPKDVTSSFDIARIGNLFVLTLNDTTDILDGYKYNLYVTANYGRGLSTPAARVKLNIKWSDPMKIKAGVSLAVNGSIDVLRPDTAMTVKPNVKNLYGYELDRSSLSFVKTYDGITGLSGFTPCDELFDVSCGDGIFTVKAADGAKACHKDKYAVTFTATYGGKTVSASKAFTLKEGNAKVSQSAKSVDLLKRDRYSRAVVKLSVSDQTLAGIDLSRVRLSNDGGIVNIRYIGQGEIEFSYINDQIPAKVANGKTKSVPVKLEVFMIGNETAKADASLPVTVNFK